MKKNHLTFLINFRQKGERLQTYLRKNLKDSPSLKITRKVLDKGYVLLNGKIQKKGSYKLIEKDKIQIYKNYPDLLQDQKLKKPPLLFEDEYFLAIDKPSNFISSNENIHKFFSKRYTLIHRLDKDTSGILLIAKNEIVKQAFIKLFKEFGVEKEYIAIVDRIFPSNKKKIESNIAFIKKENNQSIYGPKKNGKYALTFLSILKRYNDRTLMLLSPKTGRTHQLRVHLSEIKHPILGDNLYANSFFSKKMVSRLMLHSYKITFIHPTHNKPVTIKCTLPSDMREICPFAKDL